MLLSAVAVVGAVEVALRAADWYPSQHFQPAVSDLYEADATVGYRLRPSRTVRHRFPSHLVFPIVSNADGFRNARDFSERDGRFRVLVVGDSFVFGDSVRAEDRLTEQLERLEPRWRVDNMGMSAWGIDLMVRAVERYAPTIQPEVVVLCAYTDDFRRVAPSYAGIGYRFAKFELVGSDLTTVLYPAETLGDRLRLVRWFRGRMGDDPAERNRYELNEALLDRLLRDAADMHFQLAAVFFPGKGDNAEDKARRSFLKRWTARHSVPYEDLTDAIQAAGIDTVYIAGDWHWNPAGHALAAAHLKTLVAGLPQVRE